MSIASEIREELAGEWIPLIYAEKIRPQRTRSVPLDVPEKENDANILHTLLGVELKVGKRRFACPDLATARYMQVFARIGCREFAVPYDITKISSLADELETAWHKAFLLLGQKKPVNARTRSSLIKEIRTELSGIGAGNAMPEFAKSTKQRSR